MLEHLVNGLPASRIELPITIYGDDVGHGEEGGKAGAQLGKEVAAFALLGLSLVNIAPAQCLRATG
jgi:hypothetical protein